MSDLHAIREALIFQATVNRFVRYALSSALALIAYDYLSTLSQEIDLIWRQKFRFSTVLFVATRYCSPGFLIFLMFLDLEIAQVNRKCSSIEEISDWLHCEVWARVLFILQLVARIAVIFSFTARTYALCHCNRAVLAVLIFLGLAIMVFDSSTVGIINCSSKVNSVVNSHAWAAASLLSRVVFDIAIFCLLMHRTIKVFKLPGRPENSGKTDIISLVLRNGLVYFFSASIAQLATAVLYVLPQSIPLFGTIAILAPLLLTIPWILTSWFLLDLRAQHEARSHATRSPTDQIRTLQFTTIITRFHSAITDDFGDPLYDVVARENNSQARLSVSV